MDPSVNQIFSSPVQAFCIASAGALSSSAFVLPVLKAKKWEDRPEGIAALSVLLLQDLAVAPLLVILPLLAGAGPQTGAELGILAAKATIGFGFVLAVGSVLLRYVFDVVAAARSTETFVAAALLVALGMGQAAERYEGQAMELRWPACFVVRSSNLFVAFVGLVFPQPREHLQRVYY
jgi:Kef-type K+ transport system membrane component KefB